MRYFIALCTVAVFVFISPVPQASADVLDEAISDTRSREALPVGPMEVEWRGDQPPFPRLGMWNPIFDVNSVGECAKFDMLVGIFYYDLYWDERYGKFSRALYQANPRIKLFTYYTSVEAWPGINWWGPLMRNPYLPDWPDEWFVTEAGTTLAADIDAEQTEIPVVDWQHSGPVRGMQDSPWNIFRGGGDIQCDGEIMKVRALDPDRHVLIVERNLHDTLGRGKFHGIPHAKGSRIAPLVGFWSTTYTMNITLDCPVDRLHGATMDERWCEYHLRMSRSGAADYFWDLSEDKDGVMFDRLEDLISWRLYMETCNSIDLNRDNVPDELADMDEKWFEAKLYVSELFRRQYPGLPIARNKSRSRRFSEYNGENFESWPQYHWDTWDLTPTRGKTKYWHQFFFGDDKLDIPGIVESTRESLEPDYTLVVTSDDELNEYPERYRSYVSMEEPGFIPDYQKMRWGLTSALVAGAYFGYEINSEAHGLKGLLWFDEYDDAGHQRGYLGYPVGDIERLLTDRGNGKYGAWGREYEGGYVIVNPLDCEVTVELPPGRWQRIEGEQCPDLNDGRIEEGSTTIPAYDGRILKRYVPPPPEE